MNLIILGAPGSGKGTQAEKIAKEFNLAHISGGESLRKEIASGSRKGELIAHIMEKGDLVPFETISSVIEPEILENKDNFILDGSPRDLVQAEYLNAFFAENKINIDFVIYLHVPDEKLIDRLLLRAKTENRVDDNLESITERFKVFHQNTEPVTEFYKNNSHFLKIDGDRSIEDIAKELSNIIGQSTWVQKPKSWSKAANA